MSTRFLFDALLCCLCVDLLRSTTPRERVVIVQQPIYVPAPLASPPPPAVVGSFDGIRM